MAETGRIAEMGIYRAIKAFFKGPVEKLSAKAEPKVIKTSIPRKVMRELTLAGKPGRDAMESIDKYGTKTVFRKGGGSCYDAAANTIYIDVRNGSPTAGLVHEATHARWANEGWTADVTRLNRTDYINRALDEETDAAVNEIQAIFELRRNGINAPDSALQSYYVRGYQHAYQWSEAAARAQGRPLTYAELDQAGQMGGRSAVNAAYHSGQIRGSVTGTPYTQHLGEAWDQYHAWYRQYGQFS